MKTLPALTSLAFLFLLPVHAAPEKKVVDGVTCNVISAPAASVRIVWKDGNGAALRTFPAAAEFLTSKGMKPESLMNGGIFEPGGIPSGLLIQEGKELNPVNRNKGEGNFFLQPNGNTLLLGLAERADVIVDFTNVPLGSHVLGNLGPDEPFGGGIPGTDFDSADPDSTGQIMEFRVVPAPAPDPTTPPQFLTLPVWHCHIVEHEDNEMMRPFRIGPVQPGQPGGA